MRSALICVLLALFVRSEGSSEKDEDFNPTPIPLDEWHGQSRPAGTLHELTQADAPPTLAALPAHYWEDALRHSVYLTLVRDKIDQLIAKGAVISSNRKPDQDVSKEVDDHDLWEKIKTAQFDRLKEEPIPPADVTILARGRLLEEKDGFRFAEDDVSQEKCKDEDCTKHVKALWSVKRVRQSETAGKYHYELTFAVTSQTPRKLKKPYENPVRTFTVRENVPTERPQVEQNYENVHNHQQRPQRAVWFHKNIAPTQTYQRRPTVARGLERIFSSLFSDEDSNEQPTYRYRKPNTYVPQMYTQHSKVPYVDRDSPYQQKKISPYPGGPQTIRYSRPPLQAPPLSYVPHSYLDTDPTKGNNPYVPPYLDNRHLPTNIVKTTRPAVLPTPRPILLPTPITNYPLLKESTIDVPVKTKLNATENTAYSTTEAVATTYKIHNKPKQQPMKLSYFPEQLRPPVYNAPPGVFVTMDKKPFKPLPPLKYGHSGKPMKHTPVDFRPSPQVLDAQYSDASDPSENNAFRPININYTDIFNENSDKKVQKHSNRKPTTVKKPPKKHANIKPPRFTTSIPDIITAAHEDMSTEDDSMQWANLLGSFTRTTPMASQTEKTAENSDSVTTTTALPTTSHEVDDDVSINATSPQVEQITTTIITATHTTTTAKPKKRTRPPPSFKKLDKVKNKHKRITTTATTTTTSSTTTLKPTRKYPAKKPSDDLQPQASSAATSSANSLWEPKPPKLQTTTTTIPSTTESISSSSSTTQQTTKATSTTISTPVQTEPTLTTSQTRSKTNRFRQSAVLHKGTSVKNDRWSVPVLEKNRTNTVSPSKFPLRRKASKFHGYVPSSTPRQPEPETKKEYHEDRRASPKNEENISTTQRSIEEDIQIKTSQPVQQISNNEEDLSEESFSEWEQNDDIEETNEDITEDKENTNDGPESNDAKEFIFPLTSNTDKKSDDKLDTQSMDKPSVEASPLTSPKNKTKCKKKKHNNLTTDNSASNTKETDSNTVVLPISSTTTTTESSTSDFLSELLAGFTMDDSEKPASTDTSTVAEPSQSESDKHESYAHLDDDIEKFLHSLDEKSNHQASAIEEDDVDDMYDDDDDQNDDENSPFNNNEENLDSRDFNSEEYYEDEGGDAQESRDKPLSLLELMAME